MAENPLRGIKYDDGKPPFALIPGEALVEVARVLGYGAEKYEAHNWRLGVPWLRYVSAALRHIFAWLGGEDNDKETGFNHLAHAACCLLFVLTYQLNKTPGDNRYIGMKP
jgi:hypothetical protein